MITVENLDDVNIIDENDLLKFTEVLWESLLIHRTYKRGSIIDRKEDMIDSVIGLLKKMLINNSLTKEKKLDIINLLDKLKTQKESLELIKHNISTSDIHAASEKLAKKSQSAFELK